MKSIWYKEIKFETIPAYNTNKTFHPKENGWVGYIITLDDIRYYIAGDTDITEENRKVNVMLLLFQLEEHIQWISKRQHN